MIIRKIDLGVVTDFFTIDPRLCKMALPDPDLISVCLQGKYLAEENSHHLGLYSDENLIAVLRYETLTDETIKTHLYIHSWLHGNGLRQKLQDQIEQYFLDNTKVKLFTMDVPASCTQVHKSIKDDPKWEKSGTFIGEWRQKSEEFIVYNLELGKYVNCK